MLKFEDLVSASKPSKRTEIYNDAEITVFIDSAKGSYWLITEHANVIHDECTLLNTVLAQSLVNALIELKLAMNPCKKGKLCL